MSTTDLPGSSLLAGRYRLVERLGAGGMSVVWRGFDEVLGRQVAVKVLPPSTSADPSFRRRLRAEAQAAARLSHPNITNVYDYGEATTVDGEPVPYVVMELVDGESLAAVLARTSRLPWPAAVRICSEVSAALAAAHARGIVHRDVTPANVMLTTSGAKVVDFGISALIGENDIDPDGSLLGTPAYLAPERLEGGQVSPATDVYAVGLLIYRTLIGQLPWDVGTTTALLRAHQYTEPEPMPHVDGLPHAVEALIARCLEKRPDDRPSSAELAHVLAGATAGAPSNRGLKPEWGESGEDTTILPSRHSYTDGLGRIRAGYAGGPAAGHAAVPANSAAGHAAVPAGPAAPNRGVAAAGAAGAFAAMNGRPAAAGSSAAGAATPVPPAAALASASVAPAVALADNALAENAAAENAVADGAPADAPVPPNAPGARAGARPVARNNRFGGPAAAALRPATGEPVSPAPARRSGPDTRRVLVVAGTVALIGAAVYAWSLVGRTDLNDPPAQAAGPQATTSTLPPTGKCVISYAVTQDANHRFQANVTVANRGAAPIEGWKLWFIMQGDQVLRGNGMYQLDQNTASREVTVTTGGTLEPQKAVTFKLAGQYATSNAAPLVFELGGKTCETYVSGKPGEPSRPVERTADNKPRLGDVPTSVTPAPGISVGPDGIVRVTPAPTVTETVVKPGATTKTTPPAGTGDGDGDGDPDNLSQAPKPPSTKPNNSASPSTETSAPVETPSETPTSTLSTPPYNPPDAEE